MSSDKFICPVPKDQRPINEYLALKDSFGFSWTAKNDSAYYQTSLQIYFVTLTLFVLTFKTNNISLSDVLSYSILGVSTILFIFYLRIYLGWNYIYTRLMQATVAYEESGWYDGQIWIKPPEILLQDRLIGTYEIYPGLQRLQKTVVFLFILLLAAVSLARNT